MGARDGVRSALHGAGALALGALCACAAKVPPSGLPAAPTGTTPYTARFTGSIEWRGRGIPLSGFLAVDPEAGARLEIRDPLGGVSLVFFAGPGECALFRPSDGAQARWSAPDRALPFGAGDLWFLFAGAAPSPRPDARSLGGGTTEWKWRNAEGRVTLVEGAPESGPAPFSSALLRGPRGAELRLDLSAVEGRRVAPEVLRPPSPAQKEVSASDLLSELSP